MTRHNRSAAWRLDGAIWQIIVLGILLVGMWPLSACSGGYHRPMGSTVPGGTMPGQPGPTGMPQPMSHPRPNHP